MYNLKIMNSTLPKKLVRIIKGLTPEQTHELYHFVLSRLKEKDEKEAEKQMKKFRILDIVSFIYQGKKYEGIVNRINRKTISVLVDRVMWKVPPSQLVKSGKKEPA